MNVHGCTVRSPLTGCQVTSRPRYRFSRYSKWLDTFRTALVYILIMVDTLLLRPSLYFTQLHFTPFHCTCRHFTSSHLNFTQLHFTTLSFGLCSDCYGARGGAVGCGTPLQTGRSQLRFQMEPLVFFIDFILPTTLWPWGWLSLWPIWIPGISAGGKSGRCVGSTALPRSCTHCLKSREP